MRRRASPLHALLVPAPPPGASKGVATRAAICIRPHGPVVRTLPRVAHSMRAARAEAANDGSRRLWYVPTTTIRFSLDVSRASKLFPLSTATTTVWTWHSAPSGNATVPAGWTCQQFTRTRHCAVQPMMTLTYGVAGLRLSGTAPAGRQTLHVLAGHLQAARAATVTQVSVLVSFDGGKTWHRARVSGHASSYAAAFTAPPGALVTLRASAADAAGGTVTETITSA